MESLQTVHVQGTRLGDRAVAEFLSLGTTHAHLRSLELSDNQGATAAAHALDEALRHARMHLAEIRMRNSALPLEAVIACALALDHNTSLTVLELHSSQVSYEHKALIAINMALQRNHLLQKSIGSSLLQSTLRHIMAGLGEEARQYLTRKQQQQQQAADSG